MENQKSLSRTEPWKQRILVVDSTGKNLPSIMGCFMMQHEGDWVTFFRRTLLKDSATGAYEYGPASSRISFYRPVSYSITDVAPDFED